MSGWKTQCLSATALNYEAQGSGGSPEEVVALYSWAGHYSFHASLPRSANGIGELSGKHNRILNNYSPKAK